MASKTLTANQAVAMQERGNAGERYLADALRARLSQHGINVWVANDHNQNNAPFDLIAGPVCEDADMGLVPVVGFENKDMSAGRSTRPDRMGTRITRPAKKRKLEFARDTGIKLAITSVTIRHTDQIGWLVGIVNAPVIDFDMSVDALAKAVLAACGGA